MAEIPLTLTDNFWAGVSFAGGIVGDGAFWSTGVLDPPLEAPEPGRGIPAGEGERDRFCPGCPPICEPRRPATDGFVMAAICAGPMEPERDGVVVRVETGADDRVGGPAAEVGVPVLEGTPDGGCGVEEGDILVAP